MSERKTVRQLAKECFVKRKANWSERDLYEEYYMRGYTSRNKQFANLKRYMGESRRLLRQVEDLNEKLRAAKEFERGDKV